MDGLEWKTLLKFMIWGYHYFRKHPSGFLKMMVVVLNGAFQQGQEKYHEVEDAKKWYFLHVLVENPLEPESDWRS